MSGPGAAVKMRKVMRQLEAVPSRMSSPAASAITRLWTRTYRAGQDPYGRAWKPNAPATVKKKGHARIMVETGATLAATHAEPAPGAGVRLLTGPKAAYHLEATSNRPARPVMPLSGLPPTWREACRRIGIDLARRSVR